MNRMTPAEAGAVAARSRKLLRQRLMTRTQFALLDALLWSCRPAGQATARVSYGQLQAAASMARATVAAALKALEGLGLVQRIKHRVLAIGANGGRVWKQLTSGYRLLIETTAREFNPRTDSQAKEITLVREAVPGRAVKAAQEALRLVAERMRERQRANRAAMPEEFG